jgi:cytochrome c553
MACHGPTGAGNPGPAYPHVAGQQSAYVVRRLQEYRTGTTSESDPHSFEIMATVAKSLTDEEIQALGSYLQGLHPRADEAAAAVAAQPRAAAPAAEAAPAVDAAPAPTPKQS